MQNGRWVRSTKRTQIEGGEKAGEGEKGGFSGEIEGAKPSLDMLYGGNETAVSARGYTGAAIRATDLYKICFSAKRTQLKNTDVIGYESFGRKTSWVRYAKNDEKMTGNCVGRGENGVVLGRKEVKFGVLITAFPSP
jgi:hypothetical protein